VMDCELFRNPSCTNCSNVDSVVRDFMGRTVTDLQTICHFLSSHPSLVHNDGLHLFAVLINSGCGQSLHQLHLCYHF